MTTDKIEIVNHTSHHWKYIPNQNQILILTKVENGTPSKKSQKILYNGIQSNPEYLHEKGLYAFQSTGCVILVDVKNELKVDI